MKLNWKKLLALVLVAILALSLTGIAEEDISIESNISPEDIVIDDDILTEDLLTDADSTLDELNNLSLSEDILDGLEELTSDPTLDIITDIAVTDEEQNENNASTITLGVSETYAINTKGLGSNLTFKSSKPAVASVTNKGVVKGLKKGNADITVLSGTKEKAKFAVKVVAAPTKVTLPEKSITIGVKESVTMTPEIPNNTHTTFTWTTKDAKIASVNKYGKITGKKAGTTTITVKTHNGKKATIKVTVKAAPNKVTLNQTSITLELSNEYQLKATLPANTASYALTWKSSNEDVVTVFEDGWLFAENPGTATITVKTFNGKKATCKVTVKDESEPEPEPQVLSADKTSISINAGETATVKITYLGDGTIAWSVGDSSIATCEWSSGWDGDVTTLSIKGLSAGSTTVTVTDEDSDASISISVTVTGSQQGYTGEIFGAYGMDYDDFSSVLDDPLMYYTHEDGSYYYSNDYMMIVVSDTTNKITGILLSGNTSGKYTLCHIYPGMGFYTAKDAAVDFGWKYYSTKNDTCYYTGTLNGKTLYLAITKSSSSSTVSSVAVLTA